MKKKLEKYYDANVTVYRDNNLFSGKVTKIEKGLLRVDIGNNKYILVHPDELEIKITTHTGKMTGIASINTNPFANKFCMKNSQDREKICYYCYSFFLLSGARKNCIPSRDKNTVLLSKVIPIDQLPVLNDLYVRINSDGELINTNHLINIFNIAKNNQFTTFVLFTKKVKLVQKYVSANGKPNNVILVYSNPYLNKVSKRVPKYFDIIFNVVTNEFADNNKVDVNCGDRKCIECLNCYKSLKNKVVIEKVRLAKKKTNPINL